MPSRSFQDYADSGELNDLLIGGTSLANKAATRTITDNIPVLNLAYTGTLGGGYNITDDNTSHLVATFSYNLSGKSAFLALHDNINGALRSELLLRDNGSINAPLFLNDPTDDQDLITKRVMDITATNTIQPFFDYLSMRGLLTMSNNAQTVQPITTSFTKIEWAGSVEVDATNGLFYYDAPNRRFIATSVGLYSIMAFGSAEFPSSREISFSYFLNSAEVNPNAHPIFKGEGSGKPISVNDAVTIEITQAMLDDTSGSIDGQVWLEVFAKADSNTDLTIVSSHTSMEKKVF